ncbi:unnamed protein product [Rotaria sordida]|uniref:Uncharacterized protein n=1 Tax=Rotaria sordida TaxID=392033 RepID=A0A814YHF7_9BILA|nr:unnamed protein product [Rotaria sordida]CAF1534976.1 unnamed protein product [Rotaria sordida]
MLFSAPENETIRDRIEKILNKVKTFTNRKRQELHQSIDSGYVNDLILTLTERKCDQQIIRSLEKKQEDILQDLLNLKNETTKTIENLD